MIIRVTFFILMSLGLIGFGTVAWITTRPMGLAGTSNTKMVLVAAQAIPLIHAHFRPISIAARS